MDGKNCLKLGLRGLLAYTSLGTRTGPARSCCSLDANTSGLI